MSQSHGVAANIVIFNRRDQIPVIRLDIRDRIGDLLSELTVAGIEIQIRQFDICAVRVNFKVAPQRLGELQGERTAVARIENSAVAVAFPPVGVPLRLKCSARLDGLVEREVPLGSVALVKGFC